MLATSSMQRQNRTEDKQSARQGRLTGRQTDRQAGRLTDRQADRLTGRQTD